MRQETGFLIANAHYCSEHLNSLQASHWLAWVSTTPANEMRLSCLMLTTVMRIRDQESRLRALRIVLGCGLPKWYRNYFRSAQIQIKLLFV
jgi:hypothetical protein